MPLTQAGSVSRFGNVGYESVMRSVIGLLPCAMPERFARAIDDTARRVAGTGLAAEDAA